ncbi:MAG TPA: hypothetical protein PLN69_07525 [bacterium]|nr:hypothetical protein [bacterium]
MKWKKLGLIIEPKGYYWMVSHAQNPFPEKMDDSRYKIHFAGRNKDNLAHGGYAILDMKDPLAGCEVEEKPTITLGSAGCFDDCGVMPSCIVEQDGVKYMYTTGWTQARRTPFSFFIGLFISRDGGDNWERYSLAPVLGRSFNDPYLSCSPWVIIENGVWRMWYVSGTGWEDEPFKAKPKHYYHIKYAESDDGIAWRNEGHVCIDYENEEYAIARPTVSFSDGLYRMWYCYRGGENTYRAGYAESRDGLEWTRKDGEVGIDVSEDGWDSEMICYPCMFHHDGDTYLIYNGNSFGSTGVGLAVLEKEGK